MGIFNRHRHLKPEILSEYLDGRLDQRHQELVARRLADCPACQEELTTLQATVSALQSLPNLPLPRRFTLAAAPSPDYSAPDYSANQIRRPAPFLMRAPGWVYTGAASLAGLALALMLTAEAAGLVNPESFSATEAPRDATASGEAQVETLAQAPEIANQAEAQQDSPVGDPPQAALRAEQAPPPEAGAAAEMDDSVAVEKSGAESTSAAPQTAMAESQDATDNNPEAAVGEPAVGDTASGTADFAGAAGEEAPAFSESSGDGGPSVSKDSSPSMPEEVPVAPADSVQELASEAETSSKTFPETSEETPGEIPGVTSGFQAEESNPTSAPVWWKALEIVLSALALIFLGGLFFRWQRNRGPSIS